MYTLTSTEMEIVTGGSKASYEAGHAVGEFIGKTLIGASVAAALYIAFATA